MAHRTAEERARHAEEQRRYRLAHPEAVRAARKRWRAKHHTEQNRLYIKKYPEKRKAQNAVIHALRDGRLIRPNACSKCGKVCKPEGHHPDYSKPLEVVWVCPLCHKGIHIAMRNEAQP